MLTLCKMLLNYLCFLCLYCVILLGSSFKDMRHAAAVYRDYQIGTSQECHSSVEHGTLGIVIEFSHYGCFADEGVVFKD